ncbi:MAG: hypothetical protein GDA43_05550 [Hormoscilla sp. SP5CHS1]|nr:hypothetical protein [Hormoscilla sp. SP12CHS1]MBC6452723.1 hypothetical protein [Hormoscilla sp. SP5CHS1]
MADLALGRKGKLVEVAKTLKNFCIRRFSTVVVVGTAHRMHLVFGKYTSPPPPVPGFAVGTRGAAL